MNSNQTELIENYLYLVYAAIKLFKPCSPFSFQELEMLFMEILCEAAVKFDETRGTSFPSYALSAMRFGFYSAMTERTKSKERYVLIDEESMSVLDKATFRAWSGREQNSNFEKSEAPEILFVNVKTTKQKNIIQAALQIGTLDYSAIARLAKCSVRNVRYVIKNLEVKNKS